jgi:hypothetical protein
MSIAVSTKWVLNLIGQEIEKKEKRKLKSTYGSTPGVVGLDSQLCGN